MTSYAGKNFAIYTAKLGATDIFQRWGCPKDRILGSNKMRGRWAMPTGRHGRWREINESVYNIGRCQVLGVLKDSRFMTHSARGREL